MTWFIWILISVVITAVANLLQRVLMREKGSDAYGTTVIFLFITAFLTGIFAFWHGFVPLPVDTYFWNILISTFFWGIGSALLFYAYQLLGSSEIAIISSFGAVVTILASIFLLGESFKTQQIIGTMLILLSIWMIYRKKGMSFRGKGVLYALITTIMFGFAVTNDTFVLNSYDAVSYTPIITLLPAILLVILKPRSIFAFRNLRRPLYAKNVFLFSFFYSLQAVAYYLALQTGKNSVQIAPIYKANIILTVILAIIILREKENVPTKLLSAMAVTIGVLLIK